MTSDTLSPVATPHRIGVHGMCDNDSPHEGHIFVDDDFTVDGRPYLLFWDCPGQYSECRNCDDRLCMSCVLREIHDYCIGDCPMCCEEK